jgi:hypothetical protein
VAKRTKRKGGERGFVRAKPGEGNFNRQGFKLWKQTVIFVIAKI